MNYEQLAWRKAIVAHVSDHLEQNFLQPSRPDKVLEAEELPKSDSEVPREAIADFVTALQRESNLLDVRMREARAKEAMESAKLLGEERALKEELENET